MTRLSLAVALVSPLLCGVPSASRSAEPPADVALRRGAIYTLDERAPKAESIAFRGGKIVYVGADAGVSRFIGKSTRVVDLRGRMVLPGFHDSHVHPISGGRTLKQCQLDRCKTPQEAVEAIRKYAAERADDKWIRGRGWQLHLFPDANPHKKLLDKILPDRPAVMFAADGHNAWVNSRALELAGVDRDTPDPPNGRIERDKKTGEPTGALREAATELITSHLPKETHRDHVEALVDGLAEMARLGITSVQDAAVDEAYLAAYAELDERGEITARVTAAIEMDPAKDWDQVAAAVNLRRRYTSRNVRPLAAKIFADGVIESRTAALLEPYLRTDSLGNLNWEPDRLRELFARLDDKGFQIHVHAIGDRAIRESLDALEAAAEKNGARDARHMIAHLQLLAPQDIARFQSLGVIANFQPLWAYKDSYIELLTEPQLGPERSRWLYPIRSFAESKATIVGGSDWPVTSLNPIEAIQTGLTRRALDAEPGEPWISQETVSLETLLAAYSRGGAFANFQEEVTGTLAVGRAADLIVLERDLFRVRPNELHQVRVLLTFFDGKEVFRHSEF